MPQKIETVKGQIYWAYANLAMAHSAVSNKQNSYGRINYMVRAKLFKGLNNGTMSMRTIFDDEKVKIKSGMNCNYCGCAERLSLDHVFPQKLGGLDQAENLILACRACNSSKGKKDLMEWMGGREQFLPLLVIRRYLKLVFYFCIEQDLIDRKVEDLKGIALPFRIDLLPTKYPAPHNLKLTITE